MLESSLLGSVPELIERLRQSIETGPVTRSDLPPALVRRMLAEDGTARAQVFPEQDLAERAAMVRFVEALRALSPDLTGLPVNLVESAYVTQQSLREALLWALLAIAALLLGLWGRPIETAIALAPLVLAVVLTAASTRLFDISFNFINVCVLPLLLGIGVDSGVHMVHRARSISVDSGALLEQHHHAGGGVQRAHHPRQLRHPGALGPPRHRQPGRAAGDRDELYAGRATWCCCPRC